MSKRPTAKREPRPVDPVLAAVLDRVAKMTPKEIARKSKDLIGASTISNWRKGKVRSPLNYTLDAALAAAGFERVIRAVGSAASHTKQPGQRRPLAIRGKAASARPSPLQ